MKEVTPGSIWFGSGQVMFVVQKVCEVEGNIWVHYENVNSKQNYSCLVEAFVHRFTLNINHNYKP
jgi:hypothetical protein